MDALQIGQGQCRWISSDKDSKIPSVEILLNVFSYLPQPADIYNASLVCKLWYNTVKVNILPTLKFPIWSRESIPCNEFKETRQGLLLKKWDFFWQLKYSNILLGEHYPLIPNGRYGCKTSTVVFKPYYSYSKDNIHVRYPVRCTSLEVQWHHFILPRCHGDIVRTLVDNPYDPREFHFILRHGKYCVCTVGEPNPIIFCMIAVFAAFAAQSQYPLDFENLIHFSVSYSKQKSEWHFLMGYAYSTLQYTVTMQSYFGVANPNQTTFPFKLECEELEVWDDRFDLFQVEETKDYFCIPFDFDENEYGWIVVNKKDYKPLRFINLGAVDSLIQSIFLRENNCLVKWDYNGDCSLISLTSASSQRFNPTASLKQRARDTRVLDAHSLPGGRILLAMKSDSMPDLRQFVILDLKTKKYLQQLDIRKTLSMWTMNAQMVAIFDRTNDLFEIYDLMDDEFIKRGDFLFDANLITGPSCTLVSLSILSRDFLLLNTESLDGSVNKHYFYSLQSGRIQEIESTGDHDFNFKIAGPFLIYTTPLKETNERMLSIENSSAGISRNYIGDNLLEEGKGTIYSFEVQEEADQCLLHVFIKCMHDEREVFEKVTLRLFA